MKRFFTLATIAVLSVSSMFAQAPVVSSGDYFTGVSPDGKYALSTIYEYVAIHDLAAGKKYEYPEGYYFGNGNAVSNTGIAVGATMDDTACYWKDGEWKIIESAVGHMMSKADGITPDGKRIVGAASPESFTGGYDGLMLTPCYWDVDADGNVGNLNPLPCPTVDFAGRTPQYITAIRVSDDGKTIAGQIMDYSGNVCQPIVYRQDGDGNWTYTLVNNDAYHPEGIVLPEDPGEYDLTEKDFMTEEEWNAYQAAMDAWEEAGTWDFETYPNIRDYMTEEEAAAYDKSYNDWDAKWMAFSDAFYALVEMVPSLTFNNVILSSDGKTYVSTSQSGNFFSGYSYVPNVFNLTDGTCKAYSDANLIVTSIADDGTIFAQKSATFEFPVSEAYILPAGATEFVTLYDYFTTANPSLAAWMKENMSHEIEMYEYDEDWNETVYTVDVMATGVAFTNADMSVVVLGVENTWFDWVNGDPETYVEAYGYVLYPKADLTAIATPSVASKVSAKGLANGSIQFNGEVASATVYSISGSVVCNVKNPEATVSTALPTGIYVVKMVAADGTVTTAKIGL